MTNPNKVIILTGPCGVGKTTIAYKLATELNLTVISGDQIKQTLFPTINDITEFPEKLQIVKQTIFKQSQQLFNKDQSVLIDYVVLGETYIKQYQIAFQENLIIKVLFPKREVIYSRDEKRACWTSGKTQIDHLYQKYLDLIDLIGAENYIDTGKETSEETVQHMLALIK